eukprot:CAMPEP_0174896266 /NCGR_PEP_ID=MMETSP0167-20121228/10479_1 /TAXON_ID=38298 /ORGANISM="Rhodella maculata, Strain CCMP736" /LENGTH=124 /DNA_ID=CAMNT_0016135779 /DNA_START=119 /DNA_END=490 /DNA_ORIENTATION=-
MTGMEYNVVTSALKSKNNHELLCRRLTGNHGLAHRLSREVPRGPRALKVEPARDAIVVENLACEKQARHKLRLHPFHVDGVERDPPGRHKLLLKRALPIDLDLERAHPFREPPHPLVNMKRMES